MGRNLRVEYRGALYHVIQRGNNREYILERPEAKRYMVEVMKNAVKVDGAEIVAYVIMNNHYHIALRTLREPLSKVMHRINTKFAFFL